VLVRRDYDITDEEQPFDFGLIASLIFRERALVRDLSISALFLSLFALAPIFFWRILSDKVIYYRSMSTFTVVCIVMGLVIVLEAAFTFLRGYLLQIITARVDVRLSEYMFDKVLHLPIEFFERRQVGLITRDMNEIYRIRSFLTGQLFGTLLDSMTLLFFLPVMFAYSVTLTCIVLACCVLIVFWLLYMLPAYRKAYGAVLSAEGDRGAFLVQSIAGIRTIKSLALEPRQRSQWDVHVARIAKLRMKEGFVSNLIQTGVKPLERLAVNGAFGYGVYVAITTNDPVFIGSLFIFIMLSQRVAAPLMQMAQLVNQLDEARGAVAIVGDMVNRPPRGRPLASWRSLAPAGPRRIFQGALHLSGRQFAGDPRSLLRRSHRNHFGRGRSLRLWQDHGDAAPATAASRLRGPDQDRRRRCSFLRPRPSAPKPRRRLAGELPVLGNDPGKHHRRQDRRHFR
jgi:ATP-binding cassette subfamily B protein